MIIRLKLRRTNARDTRRSLLLQLEDNDDDTGDDEVCLGTLAI